MARIAVLTIVILVGNGAVLAQVSPARLHFDVVSVKIAPPNEALSGSVSANGSKRTGAPLVTSDPGRISYQVITLKALIAQAYAVTAEQVSGPSWLDSDRYDVIAKLPVGATKEQIPAMLQSMLSERFQLAAHSEKKQRKGYALLAAKSGAKLKPSPDGDGGLSFGPDHMQLHGFTMPHLSEVLSRFLGQPVADRTGIEGSFEITLAVSMAEVMAMQGGAAPGGDEPKGGSIFSALQEVGLKLEPRKAEEILVIVDHAQRTPTGN